MRKALRQLRDAVGLIVTAILLYGIATLLVLCTVFLLIWTVRAAWGMW